QRPRGGEDDPACRAGHAAPQVQEPRDLRGAVGVPGPHLPGTGRRIRPPGYLEPRPRGEPHGRGSQAKESAAMRALVTGANGFLGRHVVDALLARSIEVRPMARPAARLEAPRWPPSVQGFHAD